MRSLETISPGGPIMVAYLMSRLRTLLPPDTTIMIEAVTNALSVIHHLNLTKVSRFLLYICREPMFTR